MGRTCWRSRGTFRGESDVTPAVRADVRFVHDEFGAVGTRNASLGSRPFSNFPLPGLRNSQDDHSEAPENHAEHDSAAGIAALVLPQGHADVGGDKVLNDEDLGEKP